MRKKGNIYGLVDPITNKLRYIGQSFYDIEKRCNEHWLHREQNKNKNNHNANWISKLYKDYQVKPQVILIDSLDNCTRKELSILEIFYIRFYKFLGYDLTNTSYLEYIETNKRSISTKAYKKIYAYNKNFELYEFESIKKCSIKLNISNKIISANALGKYYNLPFVFSFVELSEEEVFNKFNSGKNKNCKIKSIDRFTGEEKIFKNQQEGAKHFNCNFRNINLVLKGKRNFCANQKWEYLEI